MKLILLLSVQANGDDEPGVKLKGGGCWTQDWERECARQKRERSPVCIDKWQILRGLIVICCVVAKVDKNVTFKETNKNWWLKCWLKQRTPTIDYNYYYWLVIINQSLSARSLVFFVRILVAVYSRLHSRMYLNLILFWVFQWLNDRKLPELFVAAITYSLKALIDWQCSLIRSLSWVATHSL